MLIVGRIGTNILACVPHKCGVNSPYFLTFSLTNGFFICILIYSSSKALDSRKILSIVLFLKLVVISSGMSIGVLFTIYPQSLDCLPVNSQCVVFNTSKSRSVNLNWLVFSENV